MVIWGVPPSKSNDAACTAVQYQHSVTSASVGREEIITSNVVGPLAAVRNEDNPKQIACYLQDDEVK